MYTLPPTADTAGLCLGSGAESCRRLGRRLALHHRLRWLHRPASAEPSHHEKSQAFTACASSPSSPERRQPTRQCFHLAQNVCLHHGARARVCPHSAATERAGTGREAGGRSGSEGACVFRWAIHAAARQRPSQCGKGIIL